MKPKNNTTDTKIGVGAKDYKDYKITNHNDNSLFRKYLHDIRNIKILDKEMINNIRSMSNEEKMEIIIAFNDVVEGIKILLE